MDENQPCMNCKKDTGVMFIFSKTEKVYCADCVIDELDRLIAENARLREALSKVANAEHVVLSGREFIVTLTDVKRIARSALEVK